MRNEPHPFAHVDLLALWAVEDSLILPPLPDISLLLPSRPICSPMFADHPLSELSKMPTIFMHVINRLSGIRTDETPRFSKAWYKKGFVVPLHPDKFLLLPRDELYTVEECRVMVGQTYLRMFDVFSGSAPLDDPEEFMDDIREQEEYIATNYNPGVAEWLRECEEVHRENNTDWELSCQAARDLHANAVKVEEEKCKRWLKYRSFRKYEEFLAEFMKKYSKSA